MNSNLLTGDFIVENEILVKYLGNSTTIQIPHGIKKIGMGAFANTNIEVVTFSDSLQSIEEKAFENCIGIEFLDLPEGLMQIGENAFYGCTSLKCVYIPSTVLVIENSAFDLCSSDLFFIGAKGSEADAFATTNHFGFNTNKEKAMANFKSASKKRKVLETRTFNVFGESITCSNSLPLYVKVINRYAGIKQRTTKNVISYLPNDIESHSTGDIEKILEKPLKQALTALQKEGIVIERSHALLAVSSEYMSICNGLGVVIKSRNIILETISKNVDYKVSDLKLNIEKQTTGLSYGVIGDRLDLLAHSIDDMRERAYQRGRATAIAEGELNDYKSDQLREGNRVYKEYLKEQTPTIKDNVNSYINKLMDWELSILSASNLLDLDAVKSIDYEKSMKILASASHYEKDECAVLALSIKKYPLNISAISRMVAKQYKSQGLTDLVNFLDISNDVNNCINKEREKYISSCKETIFQQKTLKNALNFYSDIKPKLNDDEKKKVLEKVTENNSQKVCNLLVSNQLEHIQSIKAFVEEEMEKIVDEEQWNFIESEGAHPIQSLEIPSTVSAQRATLIQYIISTLTNLQSSQLEYAAYLDQYPVLKKADQMTDKRLDLIDQREQIAERKEQRVKGWLTAFLGVASGALALVGIILAVVDESLLFLGVVMCTVGIIAAMVNIGKTSERSKYMSAQFGEETKAMEKKYREELLEYNTTIDEMNAIPKFTGKVDSNMIVKIPPKLDPNQDNFDDSNDQDDSDNQDDSGDI